VKGAGCRVQGVGCRVQGVGCVVYRVRRGEHLTELRREAVPLSRVES